MAVVVHETTSERDHPVAGTDDPAISTYGRLVEVVRRLDGVFQRTIQGEGAMPAAHFELLLRLARSPGDELTVSELARQLGVTPGGATRLVDRVAAEGMVERRACTRDRRVQHVQLTSRGRDRLEAVLALHLEDLGRELTSRLSPRQRRELDRLLDLLRD